MREQGDQKEIEAELGHVFRSPELLARALTHRSLANQLAQQAKNEAEFAGHRNGSEHNERLEFLGDSVLNMVVAEALFEQHPEWNEGQLTRVRAQLVSGSNMAKVALAIELGMYLRLSSGEERSGLRRKRTVLADSMEAVMGALYLDAGLEPVRAFVRRRVLGDEVEHLAEELRSGAALGNYKSALQERLQADREGAPVYRVKSETGPGHRKRFLVEVRLKTDEDEPGKPLARGVGSTKKDAEQDAARRALASLQDGAKPDLDQSTDRDQNPDRDPDPDPDPDPELEGASQ